MTNILLNLLLGVILINAAIMCSFYNLQCWADYRERRAKNQKQTNTKVNGL